MGGRKIRGRVDGIDTLPVDEWEVVLLSYSNLLRLFQVNGFVLRGAGIDPMH